MSKRNVTVQLDEEVITQVRVIAARRGTSISALLAQQLRELARDADRYEHAKQRALAAMEEAAGRQSEGSYTWRRDDLYDRWERRR